MTLVQTGNLSPETDHYPDLLAAVRREFRAATSADRLSAVAPLFRTEAPPDGLYALFLRALPEGLRRRHDCRACRSFVDRYGGVASVDADGAVTPVMWPRGLVDSLGPYYSAVEVVRRHVRGAAIAGPFLSAEARLGQAHTGEWEHLAVELPPALVYRERATTAGQAEAALLQDYQALRRALGGYSTGVMRLALGMAEAGKLARQEKIADRLRWLLALSERMQAAAASGRQRVDAVVWHAVATAPAGWTHVSSSVLGSLLDDLAAGMDQDVAARRFAERVDPLTYQRAQAAPTEGNVRRAEELFARLGLAAALDRRYARLADLRPTWTPAPDREPPRPGGVFGHLLAKPAAAPQVVQGRTRLTWAKFAATVLPRAERLELLVPEGRANFGAFTTAADPAAPPILQWDREDERNPVSSYVFHGGSLAAKWAMRAGEWRELSAVVPSAWLWSGRPPGNHGESLCLVVRGARPVDQPPGGGFFPESLRAELHEVRATLEAHVKRARIADPEGAEGCGLMIGPSMKPATLRVTAGGVVTTYEIDRWD